MTQKPNPASVPFWWSRIRWWWYLWHSLGNSRRGVRSTLLTRHMITYHITFYWLHTTHCPTTRYSLPPLHYHSISIHGDSPSTIRFSHSSSIQPPRTTHHPSPTTHGPWPGTHYPLLTGLYLPRLAPLFFIARSQQKFLRRLARRRRPRKNHSGPPRPPLPGEAWAAAASRAAAEIFLLLLLFLCILTWKFDPNLKISIFEKLSNLIIFSSKMWNLYPNFQPR